MEEENKKIVYVRDNSTLLILGFIFTFFMPPVGIILLLICAFGSDPVSKKPAAIFLIIMAIVFVLTLIIYALILNSLLAK